MRFKPFLLFALVAALTAGTVVCAQEMPTQPNQAGPPPVLQIIREHVKPGKAMAHEKLETGWTVALKKANFPLHGLAANSMSGPGEVWFLMPAGSFAEVEKDTKTVMQTAAFTEVFQRYGPQEADLLDSQTALIAHYRDDLSHNVNFKLGEMRYFVVRNIYVRPGHDEEYATIRKMLQAAWKKNGSDAHQVVYQVVGGGAGSMYLVFRPLKSLAELDAKMPGQMFAPDEQKTFTDLIDRAIAKVEQNVFAFAPSMSLPSKEMIAEAPDYWNPKPVVTKAKKPVTPKPAAQKETAKQP